MVNLFRDLVETAFEGHSFGLVNDLHVIALAAGYDRVCRLDKQHLIWRDSNGDAYDSLFQKLLDLICSAHSFMLVPTGPIWP